MEYEYDSALGIQPTCDVCGKYVKLGDKVRQSFMGVVVRTYPYDSPDEIELGVKEESYSLIHVDCERKMN